MGSKHMRQIESICKEFCDDFSVQKTRTHIKVVINYREQKKVFSVSGSPSCRHALNQFSRDVRRVLKQVDEDIQSQSN